jgi:hypothetical protein
MRLNGWQRIGIVASVCWVIGGGLWTMGRITDVATFPSKAELHRCMSDSQSDMKVCEARFDRDFNAAMNAAANHFWQTVAINTLVPIPIAWLIVYGLVGLVRWIKAGFTPKLR